MLTCCVSNALTIAPLFSLERGVANIIDCCLQVPHGRESSPFGQKTRFVQLVRGAVRFPAKGVPGFVAVLTGE